MAAVTGADVAAFLGRGDEPPVVALAEHHVTLVNAMAKSYTRGNGFTDEDGPNEDIAAVIVLATARLVGNPAQNISEETPTFSRRPGVFSGWTLAELTVLHRYRKRAA